LWEKGWRDHHHDGNPLVTPKSKIRKRRVAEDDRVEDQEAIQQEEGHDDESDD
jgi:hypothetical protein